MMRYCSNSRLNFSFLNKSILIECNRQQMLWSVHTQKINKSNSTAQVLERELHLSQSSHAFTLRHSRNSHFARSAHSPHAHELLPVHLRRKCAHYKYCTMYAKSSCTTGEQCHKRMKQSKEKQHSKRLGTRPSLLTSASCIMAVTSSSLSAMPSFCMPACSSSRVITPSLSVSKSCTRGTAKRGSTVK